MTPRSAPVTGVVLAGGKGRRMGGRDKGLMPLAGRPAVAHVLERLAPQVDRLLINANRNGEAYAAYGYPVVADRIADFAGPLAGMAAALAAAETEQVLTVPCDTPWLPTDLTARLERARQAEDAAIATVADGHTSHPVFALLARHLRPSLEAYLSEGERKIDRWFARHPLAFGDFSDCPEAFTNINTPEEQAAAEAGPPERGRGERPTVTEPDTVQADVRMQGFRQRTPVADVWDWLTARIEAVGSETVPVGAAPGRVLAETVTAGESVPPFARAAMDGFALRGDATVGAGPYNPLEFEVAGTAMPGRPFDGTLPASAAVRIMTGAPLPDGADAVLPAEHAHEAAGRVAVTEGIPPQKHVGAVGEDVAAEEQLLTPGRVLRPQDAGLMASLGRHEARVVAAPRVRIVVTGDELAAPGSTRGPAQIFDANSTTLQGLVPGDGGQVTEIARLGDDPEAIRDRLTAPGADLVIVTGGSSVGDEDHAPRLLAESGELAFHGVAMRPSAPTGIGRLGSVPVFLLPGNPVSCLAGYELFAGPALRLRGGRGTDWPHRSCQAPLARKIVSAVGRVDYCRVALGPEGVEPIALSGASILSSTTRADGFVLVPADAEGYAPGTEVTVRLYSPVQP